MTNLNALPADLPRPADDGACDDLVGMAMPRLALASSAGRTVDLAELPPGRTLIYCYPMTGIPGQPLPDGWDFMPGARGCTPQACAFGDHYRELVALGANVFGLSTQTTEYQREMAGRLHLSFEILSDVNLRFATALRLPTFEIDGMRLIKQLTLIAQNGAIEHVFYPVFPPDKSASEVVGWLGGPSEQPGA